MIDHLDETSEQHFTEVQKLLDIANTPYTINTNLVRGLDYYNMTAFEVTSEIWDHKMLFVVAADTIPWLRNFLGLLLHVLGLP